MYWLIENWFLLVAAIAILVVVGSMVFQFYGLPTKKQVETIKQWLLYACIEAEKELGSGTGEIKLRYVYDLFIARFPSLAKMVPFATFSLWVDSALEEMKEVLRNNRAAKQLVFADVKTTRPAKKG